MVTNMNRRHQQSAAKSRRRAKRYPVFGLAFLLLLTSSLFAWRSARVTEALRATSNIANSNGFSANAPAKEYIYAGGRLVATEESASNPVISAPSGLIATTVSNPTIKVEIHWTAAAGTISYYQVERSRGPSSQPEILPVEITETSYTDQTALQGVAYLYRVRAVASGGFSNFSNYDLATAINFEDDPLRPTQHRIRAAHIMQLRQAVDAVRLTAGLEQANWGEPNLVGQFVKANHILDLRTNLDQAISRLGLTVQPYAGPPPHAGDAIKADYINELRERVK